MKVIVTVILSALTMACTSVQYNYVPRSSKFETPPLQTEVTVGLGEPLLDQGIKTTRSVFLIEQPSEIMAYDIKPGKLIKVGEDAKAEYFEQDLASGSYTIFGGLLVSTPIVNATVILKKNGERCIERSGDVTVCGDILGKKTDEVVVSNNNYRRVLLYSGKVGNKLKMSYREFSSDFARPAFNTEVEYDLNENNVIGYAGARIEVIKASNTEIKYKVLNGFNTPVSP